MTTLSPCVETLELETTSARARQAQIRELKRAIEQNWIEIGRLLVEADQLGDWKELGYASLREYAADLLDISKTETYDLMTLARIGIKFPAYIPMMLDAGKSNMRQVIPQIRDLDDETEVTNWIDFAAKNTWVEIQSSLRETEPPERWYPALCPHCHARLLANAKGTLKPE